MKDTEIDISLVSTLYHSAEYIDEFIERSVNALTRISENYEIILVNDGSPDNSLELAIGAAKQNPRITVIDLSRNFGHHIAALAGLNAAKGDLVFFVDSDLEEPPELVEEFLAVMKDRQADVVYGYHPQVEGSLMRRLTSHNFWRLFNYLTEVNIEPNSCPVRLFNRRYLEAVLDMPERNVFLGGMYAWLGFKQIPAIVNRKIRRKKSTYSFSKRIRLFLRAIVDFSTRPLQLIFAIGVVISSTSFLIGMSFLIKKLVDPQSVTSGFTSIAVSIWFLGGLIIASLGVIGIYIGSIYTEVKRRPQFVVRQTHHFPDI